MTNLFEVLEITSDRNDVLIVDGKEKSYFENAFMASESLDDSTLSRYVSFIQSLEDETLMIVLK